MFELRCLTNSPKILNLVFLPFLVLTVQLYFHIIQFLNLHTCRNAHSNTIIWLSVHAVVLKMIAQKYSYLSTTMINSASAILKHFLEEYVINSSLFSLPEHKVLMMSYCIKIYHVSIGHPQVMHFWLTCASNNLFSLATAWVFKISQKYPLYVNVQSSK